MRRLYSSISSPTTTSTKQSEIFIDLTYIAIADPALSTTPPGQCISTSVLSGVKLQHCKHSIGVAGQRACMGVQACSVRNSKETSYRANGKTTESLYWAVSHNGAASRSSQRVQSVVATAASRVELSSLKKHLDVTKKVVNCIFIIAHI